RALIDKEAGLVQLDQMRIDSVDIPTAPDRDATVKQLLQSRLPQPGFTAALDQLQTTYAVSQQIAAVATVPVKNDPPRIIVADAPAALLPVAGEPVLHPLQGTAFERAANARPLLLHAKSGAWFAFAAGHWYTAGQLDGEWAVLAAPSEALRAAEAAAKHQGFDPMPAPPNTPPGAPALYVSTVPAELVQTRGQPQFMPVAGITLLELRNADHAAFMDPANNRVYLLVSGRWFAAGSLSGPWAFVPPEQLPADFARIPPEDPKADALVSVPGTPQAREAVIASTIPQTATVRRDQAKLAVQYAGPPQFGPIAGTTLQYAQNTGTPVIAVGAHEFYALSQGVWFAAPTPQGPWHVAEAVPAAIYTIPPSAPLYYVTYVHVYRATPTTVLVGYTPGYMGVVVAPGGTVVYGTGYVYPAYVAPAAYAVPYYPYPATYGYGAGFALGAATGFAFGFAAGYCASPYWGPYWHSGYYHSWQYVNVNRTNVYGAWGSATVTHAWGQYGATSWQAASVHAFNPYTGRSVNAQAGTFYNPVTGTEGAARRSTTYNARTGATTASRAGGAYNPNTGNYAAGRQGGGYNPTTGTIGGHSTTVTGNTQTGSRTVNSKGAVVNPSHNAGVAWHNGDVYAGHDGNVYRRDNGSWEKQGSNGWQPVNPSGSGTRSLNQQYQARRLGDERASNSGWRGGGGSWGSRDYEGRFRR
ncbi:MAG TPA: hypothetical protein VME92_16760, partial [Acetobacteraceae bacterium]|nr:hypothetical protein [Acetobacteraceae bacterium]